MRRTMDLPEPPDDWQYGVIMADGRVWGCGCGDAGRMRQQARLRYEKVTGPCLLPAKWTTLDPTVGKGTRLAERELSRLRGADDGP